MFIEAMLETITQTRPVNKVPLDVLQAALPLVEEVRTIDPLPDAPWKMSISTPPDSGFLCSFHSNGENHVMVLGAVYAREQDDPKIDGFLPRQPDDPEARVQWITGFQGGDERYVFDTANECVSFILKRFLEEMEGTTGEVMNKVAAGMTYLRTRLGENTDESDGGISN